MHDFPLGGEQNLLDAGEPHLKHCASIDEFHRNRRNIKKRENVLRQIIEPKGIRLEKLGKDNYRLIDEGINEVMYLFESVPLQTVESFFEEVRGGPGCLNRISASISGASAGVRLPSGEAAA